MKTLIYFFSCFSLLVLVGCQKSPEQKSSEEKCFDAQMKAWDATPIEENYFNLDPTGDKYKSIAGYPGNMRNQIKSNDYWLSWGGKKLDAKAKFEADAWARCMKK